MCRSCRSKAGLLGHCSLYLGHLLAFFIVAVSRGCSDFGRPQPPSPWTAKDGWDSSDLAFSFCLMGCNERGYIAARRTAECRRRKVASRCWTWRGSGEGRPDLFSKFCWRLARYLNQPVKVKFSGGREVKGILKGRAFSCLNVYVHMQWIHVPGHDAVANLVLDDVQDPTCTCHVQCVCVCVCVSVCVCVCVIVPAEGCVESGIPPRPRRPIQGAISWRLELTAGPWCSLLEVSDETRSLGLVVARGTSEASSAFHSQNFLLIRSCTSQVMLICPVDGTEEIANPFAGA